MQPASNTTDRARALKDGDLINGLFEIHDYVAEGGMGFIYRGIKLPEGTPVAVKVMRDELSSDRTCVKRFQREAKAVNRLEHVNTISLYDFGFDEPLQLMYIAMEWLEGSDLSEYLSTHGALPPREAAKYTYQTAISLAEAHSKNIIHRDLKPENIFLLKEGEEGEEIRVLDFGIAKMVNEPAQTQITRIGMVCGTPEYMSPEQARGEELDGRSDIYALGCVLYSFLTGGPPFDNDNPLHTIMKHQLEPLPECPPSVPVALREIIAKCTAKERNQRFESADALAQALLDYLNDASSDVSLLADGAEDRGETLTMEAFGEGDTLLAMSSDDVLKHTAQNTAPTSTAAPNNDPLATAEVPQPQHAQVSNLATVTELPQHATGGGKGPLLVLVAVIFVVGAVIAILVIQSSDSKEPAQNAQDAQETQPTKPPPVVEGHVTIQVSPPVEGAVVFGPKGKALGPPPQKILNTEGVQGSYLIRAPGYENGVVEIDAKPGMNVEKVIQLQKSSKGESFTCTITVDPPDATVLFRGKPLTTPHPHPITLVSGEKGTLQIQKEGFAGITHPLVGHSKCSQTFTLEKADKKKKGGGGKGKGGKGSGSGQAPTKQPETGDSGTGKKTITTFD